MPCLKTVHVDAGWLVDMDPIGLVTGLSQLHLNLNYKDYRGDIMNFLQASGARLETLDLKRMLQPVDICQLELLCPNLVSLRCALTGHWPDNTEGFCRLRSANIRVRYGAFLKPHEPTYLNKNIHFTDLLQHWYP